MKRLILFFVLVLCAAAGQAQKYTPESDLAFAPLSKTYRLDRPIRFRILNRKPLADRIVVALQALTQEGSDSVFQDALSTLFKPFDLLTVPARGHLDLVWMPLSLAEEHKPCKGQIYRFMIYTTGALKGGGAVFHSTQFRFVAPANRGKKSSAG